MSIVEIKKGTIIEIQMPLTKEKIEILAKIEKVQEEIARQLSHKDAEYNQNIAK